MARPYTRHRDHAAMAGPATRATTDAILARLHEESAHASMLHEEIPDWLDIERRPTPRPDPRTAPKPKEKAVEPTPPEKKNPAWVSQRPEKPRRGKPHPKTDLEEASRAEVAAALKEAGVVPDGKPQDKPGA